MDTHKCTYCPTVKPEKEMYDWMWDGYMIFKLWFCCAPCYQKYRELKGKKVV